MADINAALAGNRDAIRDLIAAAERSGSVWTTPRAPGKWAPCQVVEHVAITMEEAANVISGKPSRFPSFPTFVRPLLRGVFFRRILKRNAFPKAKTPKAFDPATGSANPAAARARLETALGTFDRACRACSTGGQQVDSSIFGKVSLEDFARFQELHVRHHCAQMPQ